MGTWPCHCLALTLNIPRTYTFEGSGYYSSASMLHDVRWPSGTLRSAERDIYVVKCCGQKIHLTRTLLIQNHRFLNIKMVFFLNNLYLTYSKHVSCACQSICVLWPRDKQFFTQLTPRTVSLIKMYIAFQGNLHHKMPINNVVLHENDKK